MRTEASAAPKQRRQSSGGARMREVAPAQTLHAATELGEEAVVRWLLRRGDDPNDVGDDIAAETPLHIAAERGLPGIAAQLLAAGARVDAQASDGCAPLHLASHCATTPEHMDVLQLLLSQGAPLLQTNRRAETPLHCASKAGHAPAVQALLDAKGGGRAMAELDRSGATPAALAEAREDAAARRGHREVTWLLREKAWLLREDELLRELDGAASEAARWEQRATAAEAEVAALRAELGETSARLEEHDSARRAKGAELARISAARSQGAAPDPRVAMDEITRLKQALQEQTAENAHLHQALARAERWRRGWTAAHDVKMSGAPPTAPPHRRRR